MDFGGEWTREQAEAIQAAAWRAARRVFRQATVEEVEDLAQETALRLWKVRDRIDPSKGEALALVNRIARNAAIDRARRRRELPLLPEIDPASPSFEDDGDGGMVSRARELASPRLRPVLAALHPDLFPPDGEAQAEFERLFGVTWEASRGLSEWESPDADFLAMKAGKKANSFVHQPMRRFRVLLGRKLPGLAERLRGWKGRHPEGGLP
jgi:RNA polymerase sigma factor (sigma-70 family)